MKLGFWNVKILLGCALFSSLACQTLTKNYLESLKDGNGSGADSPDYGFSQIQKAISAGDCAKANKDIEAFQKKFPSSQYTQRLSLLTNDCLIQLEQFETAAISLRQLVAFTISRQPRIAAAASLLLSYAYEGLGDSERSLASVLDAEGLAAELSVESRLAEVPARLAMLRSQMNDFDQAAIYLARADEGIKVLRSQNPQILGSIFWARVYYQMGFKSLDQMDHAGISKAIQGLMAVQKYSLKTLEFNDPIWSAKALSQLRKNYLSLWKFIDNPNSLSMPIWKRDEAKADEQAVKWLFEFEDLMAQARLFKPHESHPETPMTSDFFLFLSELESKTQEVSNRLAKKNPLTKESLILNSTFRPGNTYPTQFFSNETDSRASENQSNDQSNDQSSDQSSDQSNDQPQDQGADETTVQSLEEPKPSEKSTE